MSPIRRIALVIAVVSSIAVVPAAPASADPVSEATCAVQETLQRYGWHVPICI